MIITFDETVSRKEWIHRELLNSLTAEAINSGTETRSYEVKLLVNGIELEPMYLNDLLTNTEKHIDNEAKLLYEKEFSDPAERLRLMMNSLEDAVNKAKEKIMEEFNITKEDY